MTPKNLIFLGILTFLEITFFSCKSTNHTQDPMGNVKIDSLVQQAQDSLLKNPKLSRTHLQFALSISSDSLQYYQVYSSFCTYYFLLQHYDSASCVCDRVIKFCEENPDSPTVESIFSVAKNIKGCYFMQLGSPDSALTNFRAAFHYAQKAKLLKDIPDICINMADSYHQQGDYAKSTFYYRKALILADSLNMGDNLFFPIYSGLGQAYLELRDFDLSDKYYRLAWKYYEGRNINEKFMYCNNRGNFYYYKKDYKAALPWFKQALNLLTPDRHQFYINLCETNLSDIYLHMNKLDSAQYYVTRSNPYFSKLNNPILLYYLSTIKAGLALKRNNTKLARKYLNEHSNPLGIDPNIILIRNDYLIDYYQRIGNYRLAYNYQQKNILLNDSIRNERVKKQVAELELRYQQDTTLINQRTLIGKQKIQLKNLRLRNEIWLLIASGIGIISLLIFLYFRKQQDLQRARHINQLTKLRMDNIRNRISPHFVFNILNNIWSIIDDRKNAQIQFGNLVNLIRRSLINTDKIAIPLKDEIDFVKSFTDLQKFRFNNELEIKWLIAPDIDLTMLVPGMIMHIPVENAIKHGLAPLKGERLLEINLFNKDNALVIKVSDNGENSFNSVSPFKGTGTGLKVLTKTMHILNKRNEAQMCYEIAGRAEDRGHGTVVIIKIPLKYCYDLT